MEKILLAGSTGYLGGYILKELLKNKYAVRAIVRNDKKLPEGIQDNQQLELIKAEMTKPDELKGCCQGIDTVISTVGITNQQDGLTYMDVDYQANLNLLEAAKESEVRKFIYVSVLNGDKHTNLKICAAKEKFVEALKQSGMDYTIIRPNGYFSDMQEFYKMAKGKRIFLFGNGEYKINPIHGADLAEVCVKAIASPEKEIPVGGPEILTHHQIARLAFDVTGNEEKIVHIPNWLRKLVLSFLRAFSSSKFYGPIEFVMTVLSMDLLAPQVGNHTLKIYFEELRSQEQRQNI